MSGTGKVSVTRTPFRRGEEAPLLSGRGGAETARFKVFIFVPVARVTRGIHFPGMYVIWVDRGYSG